jgi:hypothetical protein
LKDRQTGRPMDGPMDKYTNKNGQIENDIYIRGLIDRQTDKQAKEGQAFVNVHGN